MANMDYNRSVSGGGARPKVSFNNNYDFSTFINSYTRTNKNLDNVMQDDGTMDLNLFLEDEVQTVQTQAVVAEAITTQTIENNKVDTVERNPEVAKTEPPKQEEKGFWGKVGDWFKSAGATVAVATTSVISGVADIGEAVLDGGAWVAAKTVGLFSEDAENAIEEFIARDLVSEANEAFYENTELGRAINDASALKYDSELAQGIRSVSEDIGVFVAATALTVCTGGAAAPLVLGIGAAYGLGSAAEDTYATYGTDTTVVQELLILGNGALSALSWYTSGKLGKGFIELGKSMAEAGVKEILAEMCKGIFSKETLKELFKPGNIVGNAIGTLMQAGGDIGLIATKLYNGGEVTPEEWALLVGELIVYFGLNTAEDVLSDAVISYGNPKIDIDTTKTPDTPDTTKPIETLDETGLEDAAPKQPSADTPPQKPIETLDETEIIPEAKTPHPDDPYIDKALDILNPNTATKLSDEIGNLDDEGLQKVLSAMTGAEIAAQLKDLDAKDMDKVLNALSGDQLTDVVGEIAERISKGELPSDILDKLDPSVRLEVLDRTDPFSLSDDYMRRRIMELESQAKKVTDESQLDLIESELDSLNQALVRKIHDLDNPSYEKYIQDVINKKIENAQWGGKTLDADELALVTKEAEEIAANTIANIERLKSDGIFKDGYTTEDIVKLIQSDVDPNTYLSAKGIEEWKADFGIQGKGPNDTVTVYVFQDTSNPYCVANEAGKNYNGALGRSGENGGAFVLSDTKIDELVKEGIINPDGTVTDIDALNKELGANYTGPMILIGVDTKVSDLQLPRGNNEGAYLGEWCPGGMTSGGTYEAVIPATDDYVIISDSRTITGG